MQIRHEENRPPSFPKRTDHLKKKAQARKSASEAMVDLDEAEARIEEQLRMAIAQKKDVEASSVTRNGSGPLTDWSPFVLAFSGFTGMIVVLLSKAKGN